MMILVSDKTCDVARPDFVELVCFYKRGQPSQM